MSGEGWCCSGNQGDLVEAGTETFWGKLQVGEGTLSGEIIVPEDAPEGPVTLRVCLPVRCDIDVVFTVLPGEPATTVSGQTTSSPTSVPSSSTAGTVPGGDQCSLAPDSLRVDPAGGDPGDVVVVSFVVADQIPPRCPVILVLGGEQVSEQFLLVAGEEVDRTIVVPEGIALGINNLEVTDPRTRECSAPSASTWVGAGSLRFR